MTGREWKPGDVALVDSWRGVGQIAFRVERRCDGGADWCVLDGADTRGLSDDEVSRAQHVSLVAYEDREQVERLAQVIGAINVSRLQERLREFASPTPPKPDEPTGLGAVVEDAKGDLYLLAHPGEVAAWMQVGIGSLCRWRDIDAVKVLDDGYKPGESS